MVGDPAGPGLFDFANGPNAGVMGFFRDISEETKGEDLAILAGLVLDGRLDPLLGTVCDWEETREALDALRDRRVRDKAVLTRD